MTLGLSLAGGFLVVLIFATLQSGPSAELFLISLFPIGLGIGAALWMGRPAWIRVGETEVSYVPPLGAAKVIPKSDVKWIVRVPGGRGTSTIELRDDHNVNLVVVEQGFAQADMERLAKYLGAKFTWDLDWDNAIPVSRKG